jgi:hypothetical protein
MNPVHTSNLRNLFYSTALVMGGAFGLSGCSKGDDPKPQQTKLDAIAEGYGISVLGNSFNWSSGIVIEKNTDRAFGIKAFPSSKPNATMHFSETDPVTENSRLDLTETSVGAYNNKPVRATIVINDNANTDDTKGFKEISFDITPESRLGISPSGDPRPFYKLEKFKEMISSAFKKTNDHDPETPGNQPLPIYISVTKMNPN